MPTPVKPAAILVVESRIPSSDVQIKLPGNVSVVCSDCGTDFHHWMEEDAEVVVCRDCHHQMLLDPADVGLDMFQSGK